MYVTIHTPYGTDEKETKGITEEVEKRLFEIEEIKSFVTNIGTQGVDMFSYLNEEENGTPIIARINIYIGEERQRTQKSWKIAEKVREKIKDIPGADIQVVEIGGGVSAGSPIDIKISGENLDALETTAKEFETILKSIHGTREVHSSLGNEIPEIQVKVDKVKAAALGLDNQMVAFSIRNAAHGLVATTFRDGQDEIDVMIQTSEKQLRTLHDLEKIYFYTRKGTAVPFSQVAEFVEGNSIKSITHENGIRTMQVTAKTEDGITSLEVLQAFEEKIERYTFPDGITYKYGGENEEMTESFGNMAVNMFIAVIFVFIILAVQFNSFSQPFIIMLTVPLAMIGVMMGLGITRAPFDIIAFVGLVGLVGIVVNDAIVMIDYMNYLRKTGYEIKAAIKEAGITRFMPVMSTTITTAGGILPLTIQQSVYAPLGITLIAGLGMATVLTLIIIPTMYSIIEEYKLKKKIKYMLKQTNTSTFNRSIGIIEYNE
jgi:HAE1 family hydrophobic/amphiphilic exporter-1